MKKFAIALLSIVLVLGVSCRKDSKRKINKNHRQNVGYSANHLLSDKKYERTTIQVIYMTGYKPSDEAMSSLISMITDHCNKPDGIVVTYKEIGAQGKDTYTLEDIKTIEDDERSEFTSRKNIAVTVLFLDGHSSDDSGNSAVLGAAYYNTSIVIYEKTIHEYSDQITEPERSKLETLVLNHEWGHLLGLVNVGTGMQTNHEDAAHSKHCVNEDCLMYWEAETASAINNILGSTPIPELDANCIADLQGNGGK